MSSAVTTVALPVAARRFPSALIDRFALDDGREVVVRPLQAFDAEAAQAFVRALSPASRLARFHFGLRELPPPLLRAMTEVDQDAHVAVVAEAFDEDDAARIVADARYVRGPAAALAHDEAEFALAVADDWQGAGLGRALMCRLARHASRHGVRRLVGDVLPGNRAMLAVVHALRGTLVTSPNGRGVVRASFELAGTARCDPARRNARAA